MPFFLLVFASEIISNLKWSTLKYRLMLILWAEVIHVPILKMYFKFHYMRIEGYVNMTKIWHSIKFFRCVHSMFKNLFLSDNSSTLILARKYLKKTKFFFLEKLLLFLQRSSMYLFKKKKKSKEFRLGTSISVRWCSLFLK